MAKNYKDQKDLCAAIEYILLNKFQKKGKIFEPCLSFWLQLSYF